MKTRPEEEAVLRLPEQSGQCFYQTLSKMLNKNSNKNVIRISDARLVPLKDSRNNLVIRPGEVKLFTEHYSVNGIQRMQRIAVDRLLSEYYSRRIDC